MTKINWDSLYNDLPTHIAQALRAARMKPEQIISKEDGELMAIEGIKEEDVNTIRAIYSNENIEGVHKATAEATMETVEVEGAPVAASTRKALAPRKRSDKYTRMTKSVKKDELYSVETAVKSLAELAKNTKLKTVELTLNTRETGLRGEVKLPHSTGKEVKIAIFGDKVITEINDGKINFEILLATPADMPKLARFAKILGPKGLMPNPKSGTVTDNPEKRMAELAAGGTLPYKTEAKFPIVHLALGPITQKSEDLVDNINEAIRSIGVSKIKNAYLSCTHTPSVKLAISNI